MAIDANTMEPSYNRSKKKQLGRYMEYVGLEISEKIVALPNNVDLSVTHTKLGTGTKHVLVTSENEVAMVLIDSEGRLRCVFCSRGTETKMATVWCRHLAAIVKHDYESNLFALEGDEEEKYIVCPIVPTEGVFVPIVISKVDENYRAVWTAFKMVNARDDDPNAVVNINIGILSAKGLGMKDVRALYFDWLYGNHVRADLFHQTFKDPKAESLAVKINNKLSDFAGIYHKAMTGMSLGAMLLGPQSADMPTV